MTQLSWGRRLGPCLQTSAAPGVLHLLRPLVLCRRWRRSVVSRPLARLLRRSAGPGCFGFADLENWLYGCYLSEGGQGPSCGATVHDEVRRCVHRERTQRISLLLPDLGCHAAVEKCSRMQHPLCGNERQVLQRCFERLEEGHAVLGPQEEAYIDLHSSTPLSRLLASGLLVPASVLPVKEIEVAASVRVKRFPLWCGTETPHLNLACLCQRLFVDPF